MMREYITIVEAARRLGFTTKRIQRAIKAGQLPAHYRHKNKAEISVEDLEVWHATLHVRPGETQDRLSALEAQVSELTARVATLESQLQGLQTGPKKRVPPRPTEEAPTNLTYLSDFCKQHFVPYQAAADLFPRAVHGQYITVQRRKQAVIGPRGKHDFYIQLHNRPDFRACDACPHEEVF